MSSSPPGQTDVQRPDEAGTTLRRRIGVRGAVTREAAGGVVARYGVVLALVALVAFFSLVRPESFATENNLQAILGDRSVLGLLALATIIPLIAGEFDLSVAATLSVGSVLTAWLSAQGVPLGAIFAAVLAVGLVIGAVNAFLVVVVRVDAFIATLGTGTILAGLGLFITQGAVLFEGFSPATKDVGRLRIGGYPVTALYLLVFALVLWYVLEHTPYGRLLRATGSGRLAARLSGVRTDRLLASSFVVAAFLSAFAGVVQAARLGAAGPTTGLDLLLPAFAAAFLGATTIRRGEFNVWGTIVGLFLLAVGITGLEQMGAPFWVGPIFNGCALIIAVSVAVIVARRRER